MLWLISLLVLVSCKDNYLWNSPYQIKNLTKNIYFSSFVAQPKTLDPAKSYSVDSNLYLAQIVEPPLQYDYFHQPYKLIANAGQLPIISTTKDGKYTLYDIYLRHDLFYSQHPVFNNNVPQNAVAADFVYAIKRLASPKVNSPIFAIMAKYIVGFREFNQAVTAWVKLYPEQLKSDYFLDLRQFRLTGVKVIDKYHYQIKIKGNYPQFSYWLAMNFFAPVPWQLDAFYSQAKMVKQNLTFDWQPLGTGPYRLVVNNPSKLIKLVKNNNFHLERFPQVVGFESQAGKLLPLIDEIVFTLDKESIPRWHKFLQGFYDRSAIGSHSFSSAIALDKSGKLNLTKNLQQQGLKLHSSVNPDIYYLGFNMLDPIVGGKSERARLLRQAIAIAVDYEEFIDIFMNGRGVAANSPLPPGIYGYKSGRDGLNTQVYDWVDGHRQRKNINIAKQKLIVAGYPEGINPQTGRSLQLNYDVPISSGPDDKARFAWMKEQFAKLGIELNIRATQYNRFHEKALHGQLQIFNWGWVADYPDPENFLFLLYGPNSIVTSQGPNATNYDNPEYNKLFRLMREAPNGEIRQQLIDKMLKIVQIDTPWVFGVHAKQLSLSHSWVHGVLANSFASNSLKYYWLDIEARQLLQQQWNQVHLFGLWVLLAIILGLVGLMVCQLKARQNRQGLRKVPYD